MSREEWTKGTKSLAKLADLAKFELIKTLQIRELGQLMRTWSTFFHEQMQAEAASGGVMEFGRAGAVAADCVVLEFDAKTLKALKILIVRFLMPSLKNRGLRGKALKKLKALTQNMRAIRFCASERISDVSDRGLKHVSRAT